MRIQEFEYFAPKTATEACSFLSQFKGHVKLMAGGTDLLVSMKQKIKTSERVIGLKGISDLSYIRQTGPDLSIGSMTRIGTLERSDIINSRLPFLADAARSVASPNLRNAGTIGGNICLDTRCCYYNKSDSFRNLIGPCLKLAGEVCHVASKSKKCFAVSQGDTIPVLIALGTKVAIQSLDGKRTIPLEDLYRDDGKDYLTIGPEEMITEISIPGPKPYS